MELVFRNVFGVTDFPPGTLLLEREKMKTFDHRLNDSQWALRVALGMMPIVSGVDKDFNKLTDWGMVIKHACRHQIRCNRNQPKHHNMTPDPGPSAQYNNSSYNLHNLAVRDLEIAVGAFALSQLTTVREESALAAKESGPGINSQLANTM
jgi:hypothetical protein